MDDETFAAFKELSRTQLKDLLEERGYDVKDGKILDAEEKDVFSFEEAYLAGDILVIKIPSRHQFSYFLINKNTLEPFWPQGEYIVSEEKPNPKLGREFYFNQDIVDGEVRTTKDENQLILTFRDGSKKFYPIYETEAVETDSF